MQPKNFQCFTEAGTTGAPSGVERAAAGCASSSASGVGWRSRATSSTRSIHLTGEITLRGEVTAIGGLKEKLLAALRGGIKTVLIPEENTKDLQDIPENVKNGLEIVPVKWIDRVLEVALERQPTPLSEEDAQPAAARSTPDEAPAVPASVKH